MRDGRGWPERGGSWGGGGVNGFVGTRGRGRKLWERVDSAIGKFSPRGPEFPQVSGENKTALGEVGKEVVMRRVSSAEDELGNRRG